MIKMLRIWRFEGKVGKGRVRLNERGLLNSFQVWKLKSCEMGRGTKLISSWRNLPYTKSRTRAFTFMIAFNPHCNLLRWWFLFLFDSWGNSEAERPKANTIWCADVCLTLVPVILSLYPNAIKPQLNLSGYSRDRELHRSKYISPNVTVAQWSN